MRRTLLHVVGTVVVCVMLVACGGDGGTAVTPTPEPIATPHATPTAIAVQPMSIGEIVWAAETDSATGAPIATVESFPTDSPAIIALVEVQNLSIGTAFTATWTLNDARIDETDMQVVAEQEMSTAWIAFRFTREEGQRYPVGQLGVTITASDGTLRESSVRIAFP